MVKSQEIPELVINRDVFQSSAPAFLRHLRWSPKRTPVLTAAVDLPRWDRNSKNRLLSFNHPNIDLTMKNMNLMVKNWI